MEGLEIRGRGKEIVGKVGYFPLVLCLVFVDGGVVYSSLRNVYNYILVLKFLLFVSKWLANGDGRRFSGPSL